MDGRAALIALGSNLGDRLANLSGGLTELLKDARLMLVSVSGVYETKAQGEVGGGDFYNAAVLIETALEPDKLIGLMAGVESRFGRRRDRERSDGGRRLDLDLIYLGGLVCDRDGVIVPHPRLRTRNFVLAPANEIAPDFVDPTDGMTVAWLWKSLLAKGAKEPERVAELIP